MAGFKFGSDHRTRIDVKIRQLFDVAPMRDDNQSSGSLTYFGLVAFPVLPPTFETAVDVGRRYSACCGGLAQAYSGLIPFVNSSSPASKTPWIASSFAAVSVDKKPVIPATPDKTNIEAAGLAEGDLDAAKTDPVGGERPR